MTVGTALPVRALPIGSGGLCGRLVRRGGPSARHFGCRMSSHPRPSARDRAGRTMLQMTVGPHLLWGHSLSGREAVRTCSPPRETLGSSLRAHSTFTPRPSARDSAGRTSCAARGKAKVGKAKGWEKTASDYVLAGKGCMPIPQRPREGRSTAKAGLSGAMERQGGLHCFAGQHLTAAGGDLVKTTVGPTMKAGPTIVFNRVSSIPKIIFRRN